jgi:hypothetical protein
MEAEGAPVADASTAARFNQAIDLARARGVYFIVLMPNPIGGQS